MLLNAEIAKGRACDLRTRASFRNLYEPSQSSWEMTERVYFQYLMDVRMFANEQERSLKQLRDEGGASEFTPPDFDAKDIVSRFRQSVPVLTSVETMLHRVDDSDLRALKKRVRLIVKRMILRARA